jgi:hypothetical protein
MRVHRCDIGDVCCVGQCVVCCVGRCVAGAAMLCQIQVVSALAAGCFIVPAAQSALFLALNAMLQVCVVIVAATCDMVCLSMLPGAHSVHLVLWLCLHTCRRSPGSLRPW